MTRRTILSTLRRSGAMYADELGGDDRKLYDLVRVGHVNVTRGLDKRYLYTITRAGTQWLDDKQTFWRGFWQGYTLPVTLTMKIWRRLFK